MWHYTKQNISFQYVEWYICYLCVWKKQDSKYIPDSIALFFFIWIISFDATFPCLQDVMVYTYTFHQENCSITHFAFSNGII